MISLRPILVALLAVSPLLGPAGPAAALAGGVESTPRASQEAAKDGTKLSASLESARARWDRFTPEQKARARDRYDRYRAMSEEEREQLKESAQRLRERTERVQNELAKKDGERLANMDPEKRQTLVREIVTDESRAVGARIRGQLPEDLLARLEKARPEDRARFFRQFRVQQRNRVARYAIGSLGKELGLPADEIQRLQTLPGPERCDAVLDLRKRLSAQDVRISGLPPGITEEQWDGWLALSPEAFFDVLQRYRDSRIWAQSKAARPREREESRERAEALRALGEAARPHAEEVIALADLTPEDRRTRIQAQRRERCTRVLRDASLLPPGELGALDSKSDAEFFHVVRRVLWKSTVTLWPRRLGSLFRR